MHSSMQLFDREIPHPVAPLRGFGMTIKKTKMTRNKVFVIPNRPTVKQFEINV